MAVQFIPTKRPFWGARSDLAIEGADAVIFGAPHGTPYQPIDNEPYAATPDTLRGALKDDFEMVEHWDFDLGGPVLGDRDFKLADAGNLPTTSKDGEGNREKIAEATSRIVAAGAVPLMIGGDDSTPIPFLSGLAAAGPLTIVQIDAHIDWREERYGEPNGFSSTMRRASEMAHVERIIQIGIRGLGSARRAEVALAQEWGATLIPARRVIAEGVDPILSLLTGDMNTVITLDCDGLDPAVIPAVAAPTPGGLSYTHTIDLIAGIAEKTNLVGFDIMEFVPEKDRDGIAALTAARLIANVVGGLARARQSAGA